jgi:hypothetical protein
MPGALSVLCAQPDLSFWHRFAFIAKFREMAHQRLANTPAALFKLSTSSKSSGRTFTIVSEVSSEEFRLRKHQVRKPENRT